MYKRGACGKSVSKKHEPRTFTYIHIYIHIYMYMQTNIYTYIQTYTHAHAHTHGYAHAHIHAHTHTCTHTHTYTHTHTHTYAYIRIYTYKEHINMRVLFSSQWDIASKCVRHASYFAFRKPPMEILVRFHTMMGKPIETGRQSRLLFAILKMHK